MNALYIKVTRLMCVVAFLSVSPDVRAFPELVRYGYLSCTTCHYDPNGGGILKPFGRIASKDLLSTWSSESEEKFLYGAVPESEWISFGGDIRTIQAHRETKRYVEGKFIWMQSDVEAAIDWGDWTVVGTFGRQEPRGRASSSEWFSRRHYLLFRPQGEPRLIVRAGRFRQAFGINLPDHAIATKRGLGWDQDTESYNLEAAWFGLRFDAFVTLNFSRPDISLSERETGVGARFRYYTGVKSRFGMSYFWGKKQMSTRHVFGPFLSIGLGSRWYLLSEVDFQGKEERGSSHAHWGIFSVQRLGYEFVKGLIGLATIEYSRESFSEQNARNSFGLGLQLFPRPHLETVFTWQKVRQSAVSSEYENQLWMMLHYYF